VDSSSSGSKESLSGDDLWRFFDSAAKQTMKIPAKQELMRMVNAMTPMADARLKSGGRKSASHQLP
jgi:hypothetical protein